MPDQIRVITMFNKDMVMSVTEIEVGIKVTELQREVFKLRDEGVRKALIQLGWAPPKEE